jgi:hypothetical protein
MTEIIPIITITCLRDLPLLQLQAQSINLYLDKNCPVWIVVNENDTANWFDCFDKNIRHYYKDHNLTILTLDDFKSEWSQWIPSMRNPWAVGWETQQVLKLAVSKKLNTLRYLILDSQNFLIHSWSPSQYGLVNGKIPCRPGHHVMPLEIYNDYLKTLNMDEPTHNIGKMSICTPIFFHTDLVKSLIDSQGSISNFTSWFKKASRIKSEFILYELWAEKHGGMYCYHYMIPEIEDWANPYLRDCRSEKDFQDFINFVGFHNPHSWVSINHRAWGNMTADQYCRLLEKLETYKLFPIFDEYRSTYVDIKI